MKPAWQLSAFSAVLLTLWTPLGPRDAWSSKPGNPSLKGLRAVRIDLTRVEDTLAKWGFRGSQLYDQLGVLVATPLHECGLTILETTEWEATPGKPILYLSLELGDAGMDKKISVRIEGSLYQEARLERDPSIVVGYRAWENAMDFVTSFTQRGIRESLISFMGNFTYAYSLSNLPGCLPVRPFEGRADSLRWEHAMPDSSQ